MLKNKCVTKLIHLKGVKFRDLDIQGDSVPIFVVQTQDFHLCPRCLKPTSRLVDVNPKVYRDLNFMERTCYIEVDQRELECNDCFCTFIETLSFAAPYRYFTDRFELAIYECCQETTATYTAKKIWN